MHYLLTLVWILLYLWILVKGVDIKYVELLGIILMEWHKPNWRLSFLVSILSYSK